MNHKRFDTRSRPRKVEGVHECFGVAAEAVLKELRELVVPVWHVFLPCTGQDSECIHRTLRRVGVEERCPPRHELRVERLKARVETLLTEVTVEHSLGRSRRGRPGGAA